MVSRLANLAVENVESFGFVVNGNDDRQQLQLPDLDRAWHGLLDFSCGNSSIDGTGLETLHSGLGYPRGIALLRHDSCDEAEQ